MGAVGVYRVRNEAPRRGRDRSHQVMGAVRTKA